MLTVGIDPGLSGAVALDDGTRIRTFSLPLVSVRRNRKDKDRLDDEAMLALARGLALVKPAFTILEDVWGLPRQSASGGFTFGDLTGAVRMAFLSCGMQVHRTHSTVWKAHFRLSGDKEAAVDMACKLFPESAQQWRFKARNGRMASLDGHADAALIARYARSLLRDKATG